MTALAIPIARELDAIQVTDFGELTPMGRPGGQGRVYRPGQIPARLEPGPVVVKLYRRAPNVAAAAVLSEMVAWGSALAVEERAALHRLAAWPLGVVYSGLMPVGIAMEDVSSGFEVPFVMPSGRRERVLLALEHLLGADDYLQLRGLPVRLNTTMRAWVAQRFSEALGRLHRHGIVASDVAPSNLLVAFGVGGPRVCFIDCDSMVFHGRQALEPVETGDWNIPARFAERAGAGARAADAYKLALVIVRLFARSHDARSVEPYERYVPHELRELLARGLGRDPANRPPAGEWQRALGSLLARPDLDVRYPGPVLAPRGVATATRPPTPPRPSAPRAAAPPTLVPRPAAGPIWLRPAVVLLWMIAGLAVLTLLLSRLFSAAAATQDGSGAPAYYFPQSQGYIPQSQGLGSGNGPYVPQGYGQESVQPQ